jgi:hypothetical protein
MSPARYPRLASRATIFLTRRKVETKMTLNPIQSLRNGFLVVALSAALVALSLALAGNV